MLKSENKIYVMIASCMAMFLSTLDSGIINIALPTLVMAFDSPINIAAWSVTAYLILLASTILLFGQLADRYGHVKILAFGFSIFLITSIFCGFAQSITELIIFRSLQGIGAAMLQANAIALLTTRLIPEKRGSAIGNLGLIMATGPVLGPVIGGTLISFLSWHWLFWINIPLCLIGLYTTTKLQKKEHKEIVKIDWIGVILAGTILSIAITSICFFQDTNKMLSIKWLLAVMVALFFSFIHHEKNTANPMLNFQLVFHKKFLVSLLGTVAYGLLTAVVLILVPYFMEKVMLSTPWQAGLTVMFAPLGVMLTAAISGKLINAKGPYKLMILGLCIMLTGLIGLSVISTSTPIIILCGLLILYGLGGGVFQPPNIYFLMNSVEQKFQGTMGAINRMAQNIGIALGAAITAAFLANTSNTVAIQVNSTWIFSAFICGMVLALYMFSLKAKNIQINVGVK